jgi:uncharacterized protein involved in exopolysaccharide biosynthesis
MVPELSSVPSTTAEQRSAALEDDEIQIQKWMSLLLRRWVLLSAVALLGGLLGALAVPASAQYEASSTILVTPPPDYIGLFNGPGVRTMLSSQTIASEVIQELGLSARPHALDTQTFLKEVLTVEDIPNTYLVRVKVRLQDPELAAKAALRTCERTLEVMLALWQELAIARPSQLEAQVEQARLNLLAAEQRLTEYVQRHGGKSSEVSADTIPGGPGSPLKRPGAIGRYSTPSEVDKLEADIEIGRRVYIDAGARHKQARAELATAIPPLRVIDRPVVPSHPLPGTRKRNVALGVLAGLVLAGCIVVAREWRIRLPAPRDGGGIQ